MCGRFGFAVPKSEVMAHFEAQAFRGNYLERYNIAPTQSSPVVVASDGNREIEMMRWGLIPSWVKDLKKQSPMINARAETITEKPSFRSSFKSRRCLVPADGFYEWVKKDNGKAPYWIYKTDEGLFAFAGIWSEWGVGEDLIRSFSIITTGANEKLKPLHHRMPVILDPEDYTRWLDPGESNPASLLNAYPSEKIAFHEVSLRVNSPKHDDPECRIPV